MDVFHGNWRAPKASRPIIIVDATEDAMKQLLAAFGLPSLDFAIGEPGRIRDLGVNAPVLMMSGGGDAQKAEALIAGAVGYLHKPFNLRDLDHSVALALAPRAANG